MQSFPSNIGDWLGSASPWPSGARILLAVVIVVLAVTLAHGLHVALKRVRKRNADAAPLIYIFEQVGGYAIIVMGLAAGLSTLGVNLQSVSLFAGAIGVGVGLGLQGIAREFLSGLMLIFDSKLAVGDFVELQNGPRGEIVEIGARATRLRTNDDLNVIIPNSDMIQSRVINWTYNDAARRLHIPFSVAETSDKGLVRDVVMAAARALPFTRPDTAECKTQVWLTGFSGDGLDFELIVWPTLESSRHPASMHAAYTWAVHEALLAAGIDNSAPQLDLRVRSLFGREGDAAFNEIAEGGRLRPAPVHNDAADAVYEDAARAQRGRAPRQKPKTGERPN